MLPDINSALTNYVMDPRNPLYNFTLGQCYENIGHTAAAASFYIRTAEFGYDNLLSYEALLRLALCFESQGSRVFTVKGILLRAVSLIPSRIEAYFLLSRIYERCKDWQEAYAWATLGERIEESDIKLRTDIEYPGRYALTFEKAVAAWWIGLYDESIYLFKELDKNPNINNVHKEIVKNNIINLQGNCWKAPILYDNTLYERLKHKFYGSSSIETNYSQCYQDMFVLTMLNGKKHGKFLEIGCADPFYGNNTALLEKQFNWTGISIDIDQNLLNNFSTKRTSKSICADATNLDYNEILNHKEYDYLQLDCDPPIVTYNVLLKIPFETHKFAVITFEHDHYADESSDIRRKSRRYLESHGYELVVANIAPDDYNSFEDWWVHPDLVDRKIIDKMKDTSEKPKRADRYMLKQ